MTTGVPLECMSMHNGGVQVNNLQKVSATLAAKIVLDTFQEASPRKLAAGGNLHANIIQHVD